MSQAAPETSRAVAPPLKWYGGKHYLADRIVSLMPAHVHYVEPFAGGLSVLLAKNPEGVSEVVNDLNSDLVNFYRVLRDPQQFSEFHTAVSLLPVSREEWNDARDVMRSGGGDSVSRAVAFFVWCRQSYAGKMAAYAPSPKTRTRRGMNENVSAWLTAIDGLPAVHERLRRVYVENAPALDVIRRNDGPQTLFYLDPPYMHETRTGGPVYAHEMGDDSHRELLAALAGISGRFILSGYRSQMYDEAATAAGWARLDFDIANHAAGAGRGKRRMTECVWCNFEPKGA